MWRNDLDVHAHIERLHIKEVADVEDNRVRRLENMTIRVMQNAAIERAAMETRCAKKIQAHP
jgi:hypothetical protein